jgi:hypothetical protein
MRPSASPGTTLLSRTALALYPPSWRARYGDEVPALLDDSGGGLALVVLAATVTTVSAARGTRAALAEP